MIDNLNKIFGEKYGFTASVEFSELLKNEYDKVINYIPDELNEKEVMTDTDEQLSIEEKEGEQNEEDSDNNESTDSESQSE